MTKKIATSAELNKGNGFKNAILNGNTVAVSIIFEEVNIFGASPDEMKIRLTAIEGVGVGSKDPSLVKIVEEFEVVTQVRKRFKSVEDILKAFSKEYFMKKDFTGDENNEMCFFASLVLGGSPIYDLEKYLNSPSITLKETVRQ